MFKFTPDLLLRYRKSVLVDYYEKNKEQAKTGKNQKISFFLFLISKCDIFILLFIGIQIQRSPKYFEFIYNFIVDEKKFDHSQINASFKEGIYNEAKFFKLNIDI